MAEDAAIDAPQPEAEGEAPRARRGEAARRWGKRALGAVIALVLAIVALVLFLDSQIGHRFVIDRIAELAPQSGLQIEIGRIEGSLYDRAVLRDVVLKDPEGVFMTVPVAELDWRPLSWLDSGLDIQELTLRRAELRRLPRLRPGDPDAPILPNFDIRIDRLEVDNLQVAEGIVDGRQRVDLLGKVDITDGRALVKLDARSGGGDRVLLALDSQPDRDKFELGLDYRASATGLLAELTGIEQEARARIKGQGSFSKWRGVALAEVGGERFAAFQVRSREGRYSALGQVYPTGDLLPPTARQAIGSALSLAVEGTLEDRVLAGNVFAEGAAFRLTADGAVDLARNAAQSVEVDLAVLRPELLLPSPEIDGLRLSGTLDGPLNQLAFDHVVTANRVRSGEMLVENVRTAGLLRWDGTRLILPLNLTAERVVTGNPELDQRLANGEISGDIVLNGSRLMSDNLAINVRGLAARLAVRGNLETGDFGAAGPVNVRNLPVPNLGAIDGNAKIVFRMPGSGDWMLSADLAGRMTRIDNATLASVAGGNIRFSGNVSLGQNAPILFRNTRLNSSKLALTIDGQRLPNGNIDVRGRGRHVDYGAFTVEAAMGADGPRAVLVLDNPLPAAGLTDVRVALSPIDDGFRIETSGNSMLGPFEGELALYSSPGGPTRVVIERMQVWRTAVTGAVVLGDSGITGSLALSGGGLDGAIDIAPLGGGLTVEALITARDARFGGATPISIARGRLEAQGTLIDGRSTIQASVFAEGVQSGQLFIGRLAANAELVDGSGNVTVSLAGRRGSRFALQATARIEPGRIVALASGEYAGREITMPRRAVLTKAGDGWRLAPTQIGFGRGIIIAQGRVLGRETDVTVELAEMPLSVVDIFAGDIGLGGTASGVLQYQQAAGELPTGSAQLMVNRLTRSGLVLTSRPVDLALVARLTPNNLQARAVIDEGGERRGRLQALISDLPRGGGLMERLRAGDLFAQLRYNGPADALWRLAAIEAFDLTGSFVLSADVTGTLDNPVVRGSIGSTSLRVESGLTGTALRDIEMRGRFAGSRLSLARFAGTTPNGGQVVGSGTIDLENIATRGVALDLRMAATNARLIDRPDLGATVTGPLRVVSSGTSDGGIIAGRLQIDRARWQLGAAASALALPSIPTTEVNRPVDRAPPRAASAKWRYMIDAVGDDQIFVRGMGLDSVWGANIRLRGTTDEMRIFGGADLVRGAYEFAGKRFELSRGRIRFTGENPPNPQLDIVAEGDVEGINARISIGGTADMPQITFSSTPALPEEELLSRILFGSSITDISAVEALQLAAALNSLRGGGGMDPINRLRTAIGLDRLRLVGADPTEGHGTAVAVGKYLGSDFYVELISDGQGYSATLLEYRITSWLSLLATISTLGEQSVNVKVSKDY